MKLSTAVILRFVNALNSFDGLDRARPGEKVKEPYKLAVGARMAMAKNLLRLNEVGTAYQKVRDGMIHLYADGSNQVTDPKRMAAFQKEDAAMQDFLHEIDLVMIKEGDLNIDKNDLPLPTIAAMAPMIEGMMAEATEVNFPAFNGPEADSADKPAKRTKANGKAQTEVNPS